MGDVQDRQRVLGKIERVLDSFQQVIKAGTRPSFFLPDAEAGDAEILELYSRNAHRFLYVSKVLINIYMALKSDTYRTKRDLYYEHKSIFGTQPNLDETVNFITHLLQESRFNLHILATSKGLIIGDLKFKLGSGHEDGGAEMDCADNPVPIPMLPNEMSHLRSEATFILIVEKDATFQCFVDERSHFKLGPCIIVTAKGYPDYATRVFIHRLHTELLLPVYALMDGDPYGIDIYMIYKYGSILPNAYDVFDIALPSLIWIGVFPMEASTLPIDRTSKLQLTERERDKANCLIHRTTALNEEFITQQLRYLLHVGFKTEIEAVAAIDQGFLTDRYLKSKLTVMLEEE